MAKGTNTWFNDAKGLGFVNQDEGVRTSHGGFRFFSEGDVVELDVTRGPKGLQASNVRTI